MIQGARDFSNPNTRISKEGYGSRVTYVFRVYRDATATPTASAIPTSVLAPILTPVNDAIAQARKGLGQVLGFLGGVILEREYQFPLVLERYQEASELRTSAKYIRDGYFIDTPFDNARGFTRFRIGGRTYHEPVNINGVAVDGDAALKDFKELIDDVFYPSSGLQPSDYKLYWYNLNAPVSAQDPFGEFEWLIWPARDGVRVSQSAARPLARFFEFEFLGLQSNRDRAKADDGFLNGLLSKGFLKQLIDKLGLTEVANALLAVFGTLKNVQGLLNDVAALAVASTDFVRGVTHVIDSSIGQVRGVVQSIESIMGTIEQGIDMVKNLPNLTDKQLQLLWNDFRGLAETGSPVPGIVAADELRRVQDFLYALAMQPQHFLPTVSTAPSPPQTIAVSVQPGGTIEQIAQANHVNVDTLVQINGLHYPFVDARPRPERQLVAAEADLVTAEAARQAAIAELTAAQAADASAADIASLQHQIDVAVARVAAAEVAVSLYESAEPSVAGVLYAGDIIRIPDTRPASAIPASILEISPDLAIRIRTLTGDETAPSEEDKLFGLDLLLDLDGNLQWDDSRQELVFGRALTHMHLVQSHYAKLPLGQLRYAPGIGNFAQADLGQWQGPGTNRMLAYAMWQTLRQDVRVDSISSLRAETSAGVARLVYDVVLINGKAVADVRTPIV